MCALPLCKPGWCVGFVGIISALDLLRSLELGRALYLPPIYGNVAKAIILAFQATFLTFHRVDVLRRLRSITFLFGQRRIFSGKAIYGIIQTMYTTLTHRVESAC